jgi:hypothetical protein
MRYIFVTALLFVACGSCGSVAPKPSPSPDVATSCRDACSHLADLGCAEGLAATCVTTCCQAQSEGITDLHLACLLAAPTTEDVRHCGSVACSDPKQE